MGHCIHYATYGEKVDKAQVQSYWDEYASHEDWREGCSGLPGKIRWIEHTCKSKEEAKEYIEVHDNGCYDQLAVKFRDTGAINKTSALKEKLLKLIDTYERKKKAYDEEHSVQKQKASFISCPLCKSKLSREYLGKLCNPNGCPVCRRSDIRAEYITHQINEFQVKIDKWREQLKVEESRLAEKNLNKAKVEWLVKVEYHV